MEPTGHGAGTQKGTARILVMESDAIIRQYTHRALNDMGYSVSPVSNGAEAVGFFRIAREQHQPYRFVFLALEAGKEAENIETLEELRSMDPHVRAVVTGDDPNHPLISGCRQHGYEKSLVKPYSESELSAVLL